MSAQVSPKEVSELPIILLGSISKIRSLTRFQKLAFLADKEVIKDTEMYNDWGSRYSGPHSVNLDKDLEYYSNNKIIEITVGKNNSGLDISIYLLTDKGQKQFEEICTRFENHVFEIKNSLYYYQFHDTNAMLLQDIYENYNDYIKKSGTENKNWKNYIPSTFQLLVQKLIPDL